MTKFRLEPESLPLKRQYSLSLTHTPPQKALPKGYGYWTSYLDYFCGQRPLFLGIRVVALWCLHWWSYCSALNVPLSQKKRRCFNKCSEGLTWIWIWCFTHTEMLKLAPPPECLAVGLTLYKETNRGGPWQSAKCFLLNYFTWLSHVPCSSAGQYYCSHCINGEIEARRG